jgi:hypothetical protein
VRKRKRFYVDELTVEELKERLINDPKSVILREKPKSTRNVVAYQKAYRQQHKVRLQRYKLDEARKAKAEGIMEYGGKCACCSETTPEFLTIDHINGRDKSKPRATGQKEWLRLKWAGWPKEGIQLLCYNCNCAKGVFGSCPHTWKE